MKKPGFGVPVVAAFVLFLAFGVFAQDKPLGIINGGTLNAKATSLPKPLYPDEARIAKVVATISVEVTIDEGGNVISVKAVSGPNVKAKEDMTPEEVEHSRLVDLLRSAAEDAARQALFSPTLLSGSPVKVTGTIVYNFAPAPRSISGGVLNGKAISLPHPEYPREGINVGGVVSVQVLIDENGDVISAKAVSGHPLLRAAAEKAALEAKFSPTLLNGEPVKVSGILTYNFQLPKKEIPASGTIPIPS
jgi:outer membrane biosynthesis protein TonB